MGAAGVLEAFIIDRSVLGARQPDLVLTPDGGSIEGDLSGLRTLVVDPMGIDDVLDSMLTVGDALGLHREAARVVTGLKERLFSAQEGVNAFVSAGRLAVVVGVDPLVVAGGWVAQMIERMFAQFRRDVIARQISRADEEGESLRPRVVWGFALGLDVQVAVFHGAKFPLSWQERG